MQIQAAAIPTTLKQLPRWVVWRYEVRKGKRTKPPFSARTGQYASSTDSQTWVSFEQALAKARAASDYWEGVGFVFSTADDLMGMDLDHCRDPDTGEIDPWALEIVQAMNTYTEATPSGAGLHLIFRARLPMEGRKGPRAEVYQAGRYFTMTGQALPGYEREPAERQLQAQAIIAGLFPPPVPAAKRANGAAPLADWQIVDHVRKNPRFDSLWRGDFSAYPSQSEADLALAGSIAFFVGPDAGEVDRLFRQSALWRPKWDEKHGRETYGQLTIRKALLGKSEFYPWPKNPTTETTEAPSVVSVVGRNPKKEVKNAASLPEEMEPEAYYGLPGAVLRALSPHTESHPAGILGSFLAGGGCLIGPGPHVYRDGQRHACNEFALLVGKTGAGRKGSASRRVDELFRCVGNCNYTNNAFACKEEKGLLEEEPEEGPSGWYDLVLRGLGSGEALVAALAPERKGEPGDSRRMVFEQEFSRCLKVMAREGSTLSEMLRSAWDSEPLHVRTKARLLRADAAHVSILAHITEADLKERMAHVELFNGFANRFLWFGTRRVRSLPFGGGLAPLAPLVQRVHAGLVYRMGLAAMEFDAAAAWLWEHGGIYERLSSPPPGLLGAVTDRAAAHVTRLALQYAVWDRARAIEVPHLLAGLAVWDFSTRTCAAVFGRSTGDSYADLILEKLGEVGEGYLTRQEIRDLFSRNAAPGRIPAALSLLESQGLIERRNLPTAGRAAEMVALKEVTTYDGNDGSPLEAARKQAKERGYTTETTEGR